MLTMNRSLWQRTVRRWLNGRRGGVPRAKRPSARLHLECLEDRVVPAQAIINVPAGDTTSLINAINQGDALQGGATINLLVDPTTGKPGTFDLTQVYISSTGGVNGFWFGEEGLPPITNNITINGNGSIIQRDPAAAQNFRILFISGGNAESGTIPAMTPGTLTLNDLTLQNGSIHGGNSGMGGGGLGAGGAIFNMGTLTLNGVTLTNNSATGGSSGAGSTKGGGGMGSAGNAAGDGGGMGGPLVGTAFPNLTPGGTNGGTALGGGGAGFDKAGTNASGSNPGKGGGSTALGWVQGDGGDGGNIFPGNGSLGGFGGNFGYGGHTGYFVVKGSAFGFGAGGGGGVGGGGGANDGPWISGTTFAPADGGAGGFGGGGGYGTQFGNAGGFGGGGGYGLAGIIIGPGGKSSGFGGGQDGGGGAGMGGALFNLMGTVVITNSTISGNSVTGGKGRTSSFVTGTGGDALGGGIYNLNGDMTITYTTVANNTATAPAKTRVDGLGVYTQALGNVFDTTNQLTVTFTMRNSFIADNTGMLGGVASGVDFVNDATDAPFQPLANTAHVQGTQNLVPTAAVHDGNGITILDPLVMINGFGPPTFGPLQFNGGPNIVPTLALPPTVNGTSNPGTGAADLNLPNLPQVDERGLLRPTTAGLVDLGAFQNQYTITTVSATTGPFSPVNGTAVTFTANVSSFGVPVNEGQVTFTINGGNPLTANVNNGVAVVSTTLPPSFAPAGYGLAASYTDTAAVPIYASSTGSTLLVIPGEVTHTTITSIKQQYTLFSQVETITANVTDVTGAPVLSGTVTFTDHGQKVNANISNGVATGVITFSLFSEVPSAHSVTAMFNAIGILGTSSASATAPDSSGAYFFQLLFLFSLFGF
jgi:hypothetical protein